jgi:nucleoside 2-deoxyribosyltransferase
MKYYIGTRLDNAEMHNQFWDQLSKMGHELTFNWTDEGYIEDIPKLVRYIEQEVIGVAEADFVLILLPGGRGTHCELGAALGLKKPVILYAPEDTHLLKKKHCGFYHHPLVTMVKTPEEVFEAVKNLEEKEAANAN